MENLSNKLKIAVCSDLHLEFGALDITNDDGADVLILSGDICVAKDLDVVPDPYGIIKHSKYDTCLEFFANCSKQFNHVIYVMGNHEHYHGDFGISDKIIRKFLEQFANIHLLDKSHIDINDVRFIGGTLWTDMNKEDGVTLYQIKSFMNDFKIIKNSNRMTIKNVPLYKKDKDGSYVVNENGGYVEIGMKQKEFVSVFSPEDTVEDHKKLLSYLQNTIKETPPWMNVVVVGHHAPSKMSTHPRYAHEVIANGAYSSDLSNFILDNPSIKLWTHGHTHEDFDYMIGGTRIVCNPRGYINYEQRADNFQLKYVEI
jgi:Icc-related predicted phosphoesterase